MTNDPIVENEIVSPNVTPFFKIKKALVDHKTNILLGTALAASLALNILQSIKPEGTQKYFLTSEDVTYLNELLEEDQNKQE